MLAIVKKYNKRVNVTQDSTRPEIYYEWGENGRIVSDYHVSQLEFQDEEKVNSTYENLWVVRNHSGRLLMFIEKPVRLTHIQCWDASTDPIPLLTKFPGIDLDMFKNLKWEDEPMKVRMILVNINE